MMEEQAVVDSQQQQSAAQQELILFVEKEETFLCVDQLLDHAARRSSLQRLREILDKYLECPTLLDPCLEILVQNLASKVLERSFDDNEENFVLDVQYPLSSLYALSKVRGHKVVSRFLPHGVEQIETVWQAMRHCKLAEAKSSTRKSDETNEPPLWESIYILRHWLSTLSLVPFDYQVFENAEIQHGFSIQTLLQDCKNELDQAGPVREAAASCLSAWLTRPDLENSELAEFVEWTQSTITCFHNHGQTSQHSNLFRLMGACQTICNMLKRSSVSRSKLIHLLEPLWDPLLVLAESSAAGNNLLLCKLLNKWWTRISCAYLPPRIAPWRYQRGQRSLLEPSHGTPEICISDCSTKTDDKHKSRDKQDLFDVPDLVEDAMGRLLEALSHTSTVVRWSAAKGIGRITERLPSLCAEDVLDALLEMFHDYENDKAWHGACLTLAELARRGLLLPHRLGDVIPHVVKAVHYEVRRGNSYVGAHVRDAACYTFWAFARAYSPQILRGHLKSLAEAVVLASLFDREVNCRRAASAAFQEAVGRQGATTFPNGIAIITAADFFSLGNRTDAYTAIAVNVAQFDEYRIPILRHLFEEKLFHWDISIRKLASLALAEVSQYDSSFLGKVAIPFLLEKCLDDKSVAIRHGAVLGVAELTRMFAEQKVLISVLSDECRASLVAVVSEIDKRRLYRGRGGEIMRSACCRLVECISISKIALTVKDQVKMLDTVDASIPHPSMDIQESACIALGQLLHAYFPVGDKGPSDRLQNRVVDKFVKQLRTSQNVAATRGYALAIGYLPAKLVAPSNAVLGRVFVALRETAKPDAKVCNEGDAETRRNSLLSFARIVKTVLEKNDFSYPVIQLDDKYVNGIINVYLKSLDDYNTDRRGDVGSWCRMAAMSGLANLLTRDRPRCADGKWCADSSIPTKVVGELLKQLGERLDVVRLEARKSLKSILCDKSLAIQRKEEILNLLGMQDPSDVWTDPKEMFTNLLRVAVLEGDRSTNDEADKTALPYFDKIISGIVVTSGGLPSRISKEATSSLVKFAKNFGMLSELRRLGQCLLCLLKTCNSDRVAIPVMKTLEALLLHQCLDPLTKEVGSTFAKSTLQLIQRESRGCTDVKKLMLIADVAVALIGALPLGDKTAANIVSLFCNLLSSPYPRLRAHVSQHLYIVLDSIPQLVPSCSENELMNDIVGTPWAKEMEYTTVQSCVSKIAAKFGLCGTYENFSVGSSEPVVDAY